MYSRQLLKGEGHQSEILISNRNSVNPHIGMKKSNSSSNIDEYYSNRYNNPHNQRSSHNCIYENFRMNKALSLEHLDQNIRNITRKIRLKRQEDINSQYKDSIRTSLITKWSFWYLSGSNTASHKHDSIIKYKKSPPKNTSALQISTSSPFENKFSNNIVSIDNTTNNYEYEEKDNSSNNDICSGSTLAQSTSALQLAMPFIREQSKKQWEYNITSLLGDKRSAREFSDTCKSILFLNIMKQNQQTKWEKEENFKINEREKVEHRWKSLNYNKNLMLKDEDKRLYNYLRFLEEEADKEKKKWKEINDDRIWLQFQVNKIIGNILNKQSKLEKCISIRNFLVKLKEKVMEFPDYFIFFCDRESQREDIVYELKHMQSHFTSMVIDNYVNSKATNEVVKRRIAYMNNINSNSEPQNKVQRKKTNALPEIHPGSSLNVIRKFSGWINKMVKTQSLADHLTNINISTTNEPLRKYLINRHPIFNTVEEAVSVFVDLEEKNKNLWIQNEKINQQIESYNSNHIKNNEEFKEYNWIISTRVTEKMNIHAELIQKNKVLEKQWQWLKNKYDNGEEDKPKKHEKINALSNFIDQEALGLMKYKNIKYDFHWDFHCLNVNLATILKGIIAERYFQLNKTIFRIMKVEKLEKIFSKKYTDDNKSEISTDNLVMWKCYEAAIWYIMDKHNQYWENDTLWEETLSWVSRNQKNAKIQNARNIRNLIDNTRKLKQEDIMSKIGKLIVLPKRKVEVKYKWRGRKKIQKINNNIKSSDVWETEDMLAEGSEDDNY